MQGIVREVRESKRYASDNEFGIDIEGYYRGIYIYVRIKVIFSQMQRSCIHGYACNC